MNNNSYTSAYMLKILSERLRDHRVHSALTQKDLADRSGVSLRCIQRMENGDDIQVSNLFKVLFALGLSDNIYMLVPDMSHRPSDYLISDNKRKRVRRSIDSSTPSDNGHFIWGEDR